MIAGESATATKGMASTVMDQVLTHAPNGLALINLDGQLVYVNPAFLRMWGYTEDAQVLGRPATEFWVEPRAITTVVEALPRQGEWSGEMEAVRADGSRFIVELHAADIRDAAGRPTDRVPLPM